MVCIGCPNSTDGALVPAPTNVNAPWRVEARWELRTRAGAVSAGLVNARNNALPLHVVTPPAVGGHLPRPEMGPQSGFFSPTTQWYASAGFEKVVMGKPGGLNVGIGGDVILPLRTESMSPGDPATDALRARSVRAVVVLRW